MVGFDYEGKIRAFLIDLTKLDIERKTTLAAVVTHLNSPTPAVRDAAKRLAGEIVAFRKANPKKEGEPMIPINLFGHSNGTIVILLALDQLPEGMKVDNVVLAASPLNASDKDNIKKLEDITKTRAGKITMHYSKWDLATNNGIVGGGRDVNAVGVVRIDWSKEIQGKVNRRTGEMERTLGAHSMFTDTGVDWFYIYADELAWKQEGKK